MVTFAQARSALRFRFRDTNTTNPRIDSSYYNDWLNRALRRLAAKYQFIEKTSPLVTNGNEWVYTLRGSSPDNVAADYMSLKFLKHVDVGTLRAVSREVIDDTEETAALTGDQPLLYSLHENKVQFDRVPDAASELITDANSRTFDTDVGSWVAPTAGDTFNDIGGRGELVIGATPSVNLLSLLTGKSDLVIGKYYCLNLQLSYSGTWLGGVVTVTIGSLYPQTIAFTLTTTLTTGLVKWQARETNSNIVITCATVPANLNLMRMDNVNLSQATVIAAYYASPATLSLDASEPEFPLNVLDGIWIAAAAAEAADDMGDPNGKLAAEAQMRGFHDEFSVLIDDKGKGQKRQMAAHRL